MSRTPLAMLAAGAVALGAFAAPAAASDPPTRSQARHIAHAVKHSPQVVKRSWFKVRRIRVSSLSHNWAIAWQQPTKQGRGKFQPAYFILVNPDGLKSWTVVSLGTALVGCGIAPDVVIEDLTGGGCPPGEGIKGS